jgi:hypothetical protein
MWEEVMKRNLGSMALTTLMLSAALAAALGLAGCGPSSGGISEASTGSAGALTNEDREAQHAAIAELQRHWVKGPDGWTSAIVSGGQYPDHFLRQYRELAVQEIEPRDLTESDKLNGFEWVGQIRFKPTSCREGGGQDGMILDGMSEAVVSKHAGHWSQWVSFTPQPLRFEKIKGRWQFHWDGTYLRGSLPGPQDFASAGVR